MRNPQGTPSSWIRFQRYPFRQGILDRPGLREWWRWTARGTGSRNRVRSPRWEGYSVGFGPDDDFPCCWQQTPNTTVGWVSSTRAKPSVRPSLCSSERRKPAGSLNDFPSVHPSFRLMQSSSKAIGRRGAGWRSPSSRRPSSHEPEPRNQHLGPGSGRGWQILLFVVEIELDRDVVLGDLSVVDAPFHLGDPEPLDVPHAL